MTRSRHKTAKDLVHAAMACKKRFDHCQVLTPAVRPGKSSSSSRIIIVSHHKPSSSSIAGEAAGGSEAKQGDKDRMAGVVDSVMDALKAVASSMSWTQYRQLLSSFLRNLRFRAQESKA